MTSHRPPRTAFVLAGGRSLRMGRDKAELAWGDVTLLDSMVERLSGIATSVEVVGRGPMPDRNPGRGPLEGIRTALAATTTESNLIVAVDLPFIPAALFEYMMDRHGRSLRLLIRCEVEGRTPLCLGVQRALLGDVEACLDSGQRSIQGLVDQVGGDTITEADLAEMGFSARDFRNLNTPEDYEQARRERFG